jgi:cytoskeletal protein RodZ
MPCLLAGLGEQALLFILHRFPTLWLWVSRIVAPAQNERCGTSRDGGEERERASKGMNSPRPAPTTRKSRQPSSEAEKPARASPTLPWTPGLSFHDMFWVASLLENQLWFASL